MREVSTVKTQDDPKAEEKLESLANIGREVAARLREVRISTPEALRRLGSAEAAARMAQARPEDPPCRSMLSGLEGAIRGVRWHAIPKDEREALWEAYQRALGGLRCARET